jgi:hypothetical protein
LTSEPVWRCGEETNFLPTPGIEPRLLGCPGCSLIDIPTEGQIRTRAKSLRDAGNFVNKELRNLHPSLSVVMINNLRKIFRHRWVKVSNLGYYGEEIGDLYGSSYVDRHYSP